MVAMEIFFYRALWAALRPIQEAPKQEKKK